MLRGANNLVTHEPIKHRLRFVALYWPSLICAPFDGMRRERGCFRASRQGAKGAQQGEYVADQQGPQQWCMVGAVQGNSRNRFWRPLLRKLNPASTPYIWSYHFQPVQNEVELKHILLTISTSKRWLYPWILLASKMCHLKHCLARLLRTYERQLRDPEQDLEIQKLCRK